MKRTFRQNASRSLVALLLAACAGGSVSDGTGPIAPVDTTKPPVGTVQRGTITVRVSVDPADVSLASAVGVGLAGLTVRLTPQFSSDPPQSSITGADGTVRFANLLEGVYTASVDRPLTASERTQLPLSDKDATIFAAATTATFSPPQRDVAVALVASRRGSLIISEIFPYRGLGVDPAYGFGTYLEVYNAADTTIYLDGILVASTSGLLHAGQLPAQPCESFNVVARMDADRLWLRLLQAFPGTGRDFPIAPGKAKVVAMDAINHTAASPTTNQVDLSRADFEQHGDDADIDNPFVPDMVNIRAGTGALGRGYPISLNQAYALVLPLTSSQVDSGFLQLIGEGQWVAYPVNKTRILDVMSIGTDPVKDPLNSSYQGGYRKCTPFLAPTFERDLATFGDYYVRKTMRRKSLGFSSTGIELLQRTGTSSRDLELAEPLRRSLLK
jgi:hypothetical protein